MRTSFFFALVLCISIPVQAEFVDERKESPAAAPAAPSTPSAPGVITAPQMGIPGMPGTTGLRSPTATPAAQSWEVQITDVNLSNTFQRWGVIAGYRVKWDASRNVLIDAPGRIDGSFEDAIERVLASPGIRQSEYPLEVCFYPNTPPLARVTRRGEQVKDCK